MEKDFKTTMGENYEMQAAMYAAFMDKLKLFVLNLIV
jgi:hypothetical protein